MTSSWCFIQILIFTYLPPHRIFRVNGNSSTNHCNFLSYKIYPSMTPVLHPISHEFSRWSSESNKNRFFVIGLTPRLGLHYCNVVIMSGCAADNEEFIGASMRVYAYKPIIDLKIPSGHTFYGIDNFKMRLFIILFFAALNPWMQGILNYIPFEIVINIW